jgi:hypothetical protein
MTPNPSGNRYPSATARSHSIQEPSQRAGNRLWLFVVPSPLLMDEEIDVTDRHPDFRTLKLRSSEAGDDDDRDSKRQ